MTGSPADRHPVSPASLLMELTAGVWIAPALFAIARLGVADDLGDEEKDVEALAARAGAHGSALYRVLRALASVGVFEETAARHFRLTPAGRLLRADVPGSLRDLVLMTPNGGRELLESVKTGADSFRRKHGVGLFEYLEKNPESSKLYGASMAAMSAAESKALLESGVLERASKVVDVGGGHGAVMIEVLKHLPAAVGVVFDLPRMVEVAASNVRAAGLERRCECVGGSFFDSVPAGGDAYLLASVLHDWSDDDAARILKNVRARTPAHGRVVLVERVIPEGNDRSFVKLLDVVMLVSLGGRERTLAEYDELLRACGFELERSYADAPLVSVLEARAR